MTITRPDDWHVHLRDGALLEGVAAATARDFARAIVMPNLVPPVTTTANAAAYRERIRAATSEFAFEPLMTVYLTDNTDPADLCEGHRDGTVFAAKLYPAGATTNADAGVTDILALNGVFEAMQDAGVPLLMHGEVVGDEHDIFDREAIFIDQILSTLRDRFSGFTYRSRARYDRRRGCLRQ